MDLGRMLASLDPAQREAVTSTAQPLAIIASAGSGKTTVLTRRIAYRVAIGTADPSHVVALTFTRDAANELRRRIRRLDLREPIEAGTFHAVALRLLRDRALATNQTMPRVANDRWRLIRDALAELRLPLDPGAAMADIDWARARRVTPQRYAAASRQTRRKGATPPDRYADLLAAYTRVKRRKGVVDFDDLLERMLDALGDQRYAEAIGWRFRHFFVDEAQDLNPLQHAVLEAWRQGRPDLCFVGDPRQAIYSWNGADPQLLAEVERNYPGITVVQLTANYRCSPQVVRAGAAVLTQIGIDDPAASQREDGPPVAVVTCADEQDEAASVARSIRSLDASPADVAVLARTNEQLGPIVTACTAAGIPVGHGSARSPVDRVVAEVDRCTSRADMERWAIDHWTATDPLGRRVADQVDRFLAASAAGTFRAWVEHEQPFDDLESPDEAAVTVATFHGAKGREWDHVLIVGTNDGLTPHASAVTTAQLHEECRLFYVAVTRARRSLTVLTTERRRGASAVESPWLAGLRAAAAVDRPVPSPLPRRRRAEDPLAAWKAWRRLVARGAGIEEHVVCSDRQLLELHHAGPQDAATLAAVLGITPTSASLLPPVPTASGASR